MKFLQSVEPKFSQLKGNNSFLYYYGSINMPWEDVLSTLEEERFPHQIRGNFAFVWEGADDTVAAVDHVTTFSIFYSDKYVSHIYAELLDTVASPTDNMVAQRQLEIMNGLTIGEMTLCKEISRLQPGHYLKKGQQHCYIELGEYLGDEEFDVEKFSSLLENSILNNSESENVLLTSSGTDSITLAAIIKKLDLSSRFRFLHIYSTQGLFSELSLTESIYKEMALPLETFDIGTEDTHYLGVQDRKRMYGFWIDHYIASKQYAISKMGYQDRKIFCGEVGDQLFGGSKFVAQIPYVFQAPSWDEYDIARIFISASHNPKYPSAYPTPFERAVRENQYFGEAYEILLETIAKTFKEARTKDLINRFILIHFLYKAPQRMWAQSQSRLDFWHPIAEWNFVDYCFKISSREKIKKGILKYIFMRTWGDLIPEEVFYQSKRGMGMPKRTRSIGEYQRI